MYSFWVFSVTDNEFCLLFLSFELAVHFSKHSSVQPMDIVPKNIRSMATLLTGKKYIVQQFFYTLFQDAENHPGKLCFPAIIYVSFIIVNYK